MEDIQKLVDSGADGRVSNNFLNPILATSDL